MRPWVIFCGILWIACARAEDGQSAAGPTFLGYLSSAGKWQFAVAPERGARPIWLRLNQTENGLTVQKYDPVTETLAVEIRGRLIELKLEGGAGPKSATPLPNVNRQQALQIARREVLSREGWRNPRMFAATTSNGNFQILISQSSPLHTERRTVVIRPDGQMGFYLALPDLPQGVPDLLFPTYKSGKSYSFIPRSPWSSYPDDRKIRCNETFVLHATTSFTLNGSSIAATKYPVPQRRRATRRHPPDRPTLDPADDLDGVVAFSFRAKKGASQWW
jgi:hypothetical protein